MNIESTDVRIPLQIPGQRDFDVVGFGLNAVDHLIVVPQYPEFDTKSRFTQYEKAPGGQTATAMVALQRLGLKTAYGGRFGSDDAGRFIVASLALVEIDWLGQRRIARAVISDGVDALIGAELLDGNRLVVDYIRDQVMLTTD